MEPRTNLFLPCFCIKYILCARNFISFVSSDSHDNPWGKGQDPHFTAEKPEVQSHRLSPVRAEHLQTAEQKV